MAATFTQVPPRRYLAALARAEGETKAGGVTVASMLGTYTEAGLQEASALCWLTEDERTGFVVVDADLQGLFNVGPAGRGSDAVAHAIRNGARTLDCFEPFLPAYYARHGFVVDRWEDNWTPGGPRVAYMRHAPLAAALAALEAAGGAQ